MMEQRRRILVIGAGAAGMVAIKSCLEEGLDPVCYERHDQLGGIWYYSEELRPGQTAAAYKSVLTNNTKEIFQFSDFPVPPEKPIVLQHAMVHEYLTSYSHKFGLDKYVHYNRNVVKVEMAEDFDATGQWQVSYHDRDEDVKLETFDGVMVCSGGGCGDVFIPDIPGLDEFQGMTMHANAYRQPMAFQGKRVIVIGGANTAGEISSELGRSHCSQVYLSLRTPSMVIPRLCPDGWPLDMYVSLRILQLIPGYFMKRLTTRNSRCTIFNPGLHNSSPGAASLTVMVNDEMPERIACNHVSIIPDLTRFGETSVELVDGSILDDIDIVIFATGYQISYPIIDESLIFDSSEKLNLYRYMLPVGMKHNTLMVVGTILKFIPTTWSMLELQARWGARVLSGKLQLPNSKNMVKDIKRRPVVGRTYHMMMCTLYQDDMARDIGALPSFWTLMFPDPRLLFAYYFGASVGAWYRLQGPATWSGAKQSILNSWHNTKYTINKTTDIVKEERQPSLCKRSIVFAAGLCIAYMLANSDRAHQIFILLHRVC